jgi:hypothetical protein
MSKLIGYWSLNKGSGLVARDLSGYKNDGDLEGDNPSWIDGKSGKAIYLPGTDERLNCRNPYPLNQLGNSSFWIPFWMKSKDSVPLSYCHIWNKYEDASNSLSLNASGTANRLYMHLEKNDILANGSFSISSAPFNSIWNHIVFVVNRITDKALIYVNTVKDGTEIDISALPADISNAGNVSWGAVHNGTGPYEGALDELRIYTGVPTQADIDVLHDNPGGTIADYNTPEGIQIQLISPSIERLAILSDTDLSGQILNAKINEKKIGGVDKFSFNIPRSVDVPITRNTECYFYINGELWKSGYVKEVPKSDQTDPVLTVRGEGFYKRLLKKVINETYTTKTLDVIVKDIANTYLGSDLGIYYDVSKIDTPTIADITIEFKDKNLFKVFETLLEIANYDYENEKYRFYIDNDKDFVFELISDSFQTKLFEGYQYQLPEVSVDNSKIVNKILAFRTKLVDPDVVEYVAIYQDTESQGQFGIFEKKITFPDYIDTTTISKICAFLLTRKSFPENKMKIENYEVSSALIFGKYGIFNRREKYWRIIADCNTLNGWNTYLSNTTFELSETHVLTGKRSLKFTTAAGSNGEYVEYILDKAISLPQIVRIFAYFESVTIEFRVTFYDDYGNEIIINPGSSNQTLLSDQWIKLSEEIDQKTTVDNMIVDSNGATDDFIINIDAVTEDDLDVRYEILIDNILADPNGDTDDLEVNLSAVVDGNLDVKYREQSGLLGVKKVRITMLTDTAAVFYIDRIDVLANIYNFYELQLEEIEYNLASIGLFANMNFGEKEDSILDEIKDQVKEGSTALEIFSKQ